MSSGLAFVRPLDGPVRFTTYSGTADVLRPTLHGTPHAAGAMGDAGDPWTPCPCSTVSPVEVWTTYGGGFGWSALACPHRVSDEFLSPHGSEDANGRQVYPARDLVETMPAWVREVSP